MSVNNFDTEQLIKQLQELPELEPPEGIVNEVMHRVRPANKGMWCRFTDYMTRPHLVTLRPLPVFSIATLMAITFWLGMMAGMNRVATIPQPSQDDIVAKVLKDVETSFHVGRSLLNAGLSKEALPLLHNASLADPDNPEYAYWEGLCFWANGMVEKERSSYMRGINSSPETVPLLLNLGHNFLEHKEFNSALTQYDKVLSIVSHEKKALYNRALIYNLLADSENERTAWKSYLDHYRLGKNAFQAVSHLNDLNDYTYRTYQLGNRKVILKQTALLTLLPTTESQPDVEILAHGLHKDPTLSIDIVVFHENDAQAAKSKAILLKKNMLAVLGEKENERIRLSWFGEKEKIQTPGAIHELSESILLFGRHNIKQDKETII